MFPFSSEEGVNLVRQVVQDLWPHVPRDHQLEAVTKALDGTDVLAILPTGAGKTAIITMFVLVLNHMKENPAEYAQHGARFPADPIAVVVYPTNCLEEEQVCMYMFRDVLFNALRVVYPGCYVQGGRADDRRHQC
jgi:ATP-dependent helicase YprA (DUF1998 family)